ncbi:MAG: polyhydroxyalkanoic acid system family protein [Myxococcales bacterium]|nr:polyhydroxyalkanoic acid system family protein [Myxococcales bacterium]
MSKVHVRKAHSLGVEGARVALESFVGELAKRGARLEWAGPTAQVKGPGVSGTVEISPSAVEVSIQLGLLARAAGVKADKLEASISKRLQEALG